MAVAVVKSRQGEADLRAARLVRCSNPIEIANPASRSETTPSRHGVQTLEADALEVVSMPLTATQAETARKKGESKQQQPPAGQALRGEVFTRESSNATDHSIGWTIPKEATTDREI